MLLILLHAIDIRGRLVGVTSDFFDEFGRDAAYECAGAYIFGYYCSCGYYRSVADGYTGCYGNICPYPYIISDAYGFECHRTSVCWVLVMVYCCHHAIMTNQGAVSDKDASLILEFTSHIDKHIFPYVQVLPIICVDGWEKPYRTIDFGSGELRQ